MNGESNSTTCFVVGIFELSDVNLKLIDKVTLIFILQLLFGITSKQFHLNNAAGMQSYFNFQANEQNYIIFVYYGII